jgi:hypothetical protein
MVAGHRGTQNTYSAGGQVLVGAAGRCGLTALSAVFGL